MNTLGIVTVAVALSLGAGCVTQRTAKHSNVIDQDKADVGRHFSRKRPGGLSFQETGVEVMVTKLSAASARVGVVYKRRIDNISPKGSRYDDTVILFNEIECRSGESAEYRLEIDPVQGPRFVRGTIVPNQDGIWLKISCVADNDAVIVDYSFEARDGDLTSARLTGRQRAADRGCRECPE